MTEVYDKYDGTKYPRCNQWISRMYSKVYLTGAASASDEGASCSIYCFTKGHYIVKWAYVFP